MGYERLRPAQLRFIEIRGEKRPGVVTAQPRFLLQNEHGEFRAQLTKPVGAKATGEPTPDENDVVVQSACPR